MDKQKGGEKMNEIKKALQDLATAIENQTAVETVKITITLKKPKSSKATMTDDK